MAKSAKWLLILMLVLSSAPMAAQEPERVQGSGALMLISDAKDASAFFATFFHHLNRRLIAWWAAGGRNAVRGQWSVFVTEDVTDDGARRGIVVYAIREGKGEGVLPIFRAPQEPHHPVTLAATAAERTRQKLLRIEAERQKETTREGSRR